MLDLIVSVFNNNVYLINFIIIFFGSLIVTNFFTPYSTILLISNVNSSFSLTINLVMIAFVASFLSSQTTFVISTKIKKKINKIFKENKSFIFAKDNFFKHGEKIIGLMYFLGPIKAPFIFMYGISNNNKKFIYSNLILSFIWSLTICLQGKLIFYITKFLGDAFLIKILIIIFLTFSVNFCIYKKLNKPG